MNAIESGDGRRAQKARLNEAAVVHPDGAANLVEQRRRRSSSKTAAVDRRRVVHREHGAVAIQKQRRPHTGNLPLTHKVGERVIE